MKKLYTKYIPILCLVLFFVLPSASFAECSLDTSAPKTLTEYTKQVEQEISDIQNKLKSENKCDLKNGNKNLLINIMLKNIDQNMTTFIDGEFNNTLEKNGTMKQAVKRDVEFLQKHEKTLIETVRNISAKCRTDGGGGTKLIDILLEHKGMQTTLKRTALGKGKSVPGKHIRDTNISTWEDITKTYHPSSTMNCESTSDYKEKIQKSQKNISRIGWNIEDALTGWRKGISLFRGGSGMSTSEYAAEKKKILMAELSRQGAVSSTRKTILNNFDCFKAKTADYTQPEEVMNARISCISNPISGLDADFLKWKNYVYESKNLQQITERAQRMMTRQDKSVDIASTYSELVSMTSAQQDIDENTIESLVTLHISLMITNKLLEERIPKMQENCMKAQPGVVGGCRD